MAKYNTFVVHDCRKRKVVMVTSSARKAKENLHVGVKIEVWNENKLFETIYSKHFKDMDKYIQLEKKYHTEKQQKAESRNRRKKYVRYVS